MNINLYTLDWVAISAIATLIMAVATFITLIQNRKQVKELERQWTAQNRPRIMPLLVKHNGRGYLRIKNISNIAAFEVIIDILTQDETILKDKYIFYEPLRKSFESTKFTLDPLGHKDFLFIFTIWPEYKYEGRLSMTIKYNSTYIDEFQLHLSEYNVIEDSITNENAIAKNILKLTSAIETKKL